MSLQAKFAILVGLLGVTVLGSLAGSVVTVEIEHRQLSEPLRSMTRAVDGLARIEHGIGVLDRLLRDSGAPHPESTEAPARVPEGGVDPDLVLQFDEKAENLARQVEELSRNELDAERSGRGTSRNISGRLQSFHELGRAWLTTQDPKAGWEARRAAEDLRSLVRLVEGHAFDVQSQAMEHAEVIRLRLFVVLAAALVAALLVSLLALILLRRWVSGPVSELRTATERIGAGEFSHRVAGADARGDEIERLAHEVNHMAGMIQAMLDERVGRERLAAIGEMVRRLAHNQRNILGGVRNLAELAREELPASSELRQVQQRIIHAVDRFERWLADLLAVTSDRPLAVAPEVCEVRPLLAGVSAAVRPLIESRALILEIDDARAPLEAVFDPRHLEHTLVAIVTNAAQASPPGGLVRVTAETAETGRWRVIVADQGPGVPPEIRDRIFSPYFTTRKDGNGIGLTVAQQVVRAHGGQLRLEEGLGAVPGKQPCGPGAAFVVELPISGPSVVEPLAGGTLVVNSPAGEAEAPRARRGKPSRGAKVGTDPDHRGRREHSLLDH
jgi:signal transduction histidine kinase